MTSGSERLLTWPGKSPVTPDMPEHPAAYHMLDVAAVAELLLQLEPLPRAACDAFTLLIALHDLGKVNDDFRRMLRDEPRRGGGARHWELSEILLKKNAGRLGPHLQLSLSSLDPLLSAVAGHHGRPSALTPRDADKALFIAGSQAQRDAAEIVAAFAELWPHAGLEGLTEDEARDRSWWLPGLTAAADWVGSNSDWFPAVAAGPGLAEYLTLARDRAKRAVAAAGLGGAGDTRADFLSLPHLRPMQQACRDIALPDGPMLAVIEDETGSGKTEAALLLAQRMLAAGKGRGLYFALPTMATADSMFARAAGHLGAMFHGAPSLTLAHGRAAQSPAFRDLPAPDPNAPEDPGCTDWLKESRRRALLADIGVGTIDQALLSAMPVKWQTLRHYGLASKILIVDEVHEMGEPYIAEVLAQVLRMHRSAGGSAILMTATLPLAQRQALLAVYGHCPDRNRAYPALTIAGGEARRDLPQRVGARGPVRVARLADQAAAVELLAQAAGQGAACVWVRNAVDDAIAAVRALQEKGVEAALLHARFALGDRKRIEALQLARFGKAGTGRAGKVLVGTQVLESSLDLDFDVMVSDLAPVAALIQRAGRLWRHMEVRPTAGRPVPAPVLHVLSPDPAAVEGSRWLHGTLDKGAFVYPAALQWRTADHLFREGQIVAPSGLRGLIEVVHGEDAAPVPAALERAEIEAEGKDASHRTHAWHNIARLDDGYRQGGRANDDAAYPTRLGQPQQAVMLVHPDGRPWIAGPEGQALSELSLAASRLKGLDLPDQTQPAIVALMAGWPEWKRATVRVLPVGQGGRICEGLRYDADLGMMFDAG